MFYGEYIHTLDNKDRFILPSKFRSILKEKKIKKLYLTRGLDNCLFIFPDFEWKRIEDSLKTLPLTKQNARIFNRIFFSGAVEIVLDSVGRLTIPQYLKEFAHINKEIVLIGVAFRIEIWAKELWVEFYKKHKELFDKISEDLII